jgi:DNA-binding XRE family transcriptional regulator
LDHYYFDVLQLHPPPEYLESLTSYLTRIAEMNGINGNKALATLCFSEESVNLWRLKDYPHSSFSTLQSTIVKSEATLLKTTFHHLGKKFEYSTDVFPLSNFLSGSVSDCLRYCPLCLGDFPYYSLVWRFLALEGCWVHNCHLLEKCGHCGTKIPIFAYPFKVGTCPTCKKSLRTCVSSSLSKNMRKRTLSLYQDLEFLLTPQPIESIERNLRQDIGLEFTYMRRSNNLTIQQMSQQVGISIDCLVNLENGKDSEDRVTSFKWYYKYAGFFGVTIRELFQRIVQPEALEKRSQLLKKKRILDEDEIIKSIHEVLRRVNESGERVTLKAISEAIHVSLSRLYKYPRIKTLLEEIEEQIQAAHRNQSIRREDKMLEKVQKSLEQLEKRKVAITHRAVSEITGVPSSNFDYYPRVKALLDQKINYVSYQDRRRQQTENEMLAKVRTAIQDLEEHNQPITANAVSEMTDIYPNSLIEYPRVKALLERRTNATEYSISITARHRFEDELLVKVEAAAQQLKDQGQKVTRRSIGVIVEMDPKNLSSWPRVKALLDKLLGVYRPNQLIQFRKREDELLLEVEQAIYQLEQLGKPVTHIAVSQIIGISPESFRRYPSVKNLIEQKVGNYHHHRLQQAQERETELLEQVYNAIEQLKLLGVPITQKAVSEYVGRSQRLFAYYPRVKALLDQETSRMRTKRTKTTLTEDELHVKVSVAIKELEKSGLPVTQTVVSQKLQVPLVDLKRYPSVNSLFKQAAEKREQKREEDFMVLVKGVVQEFLDLELPITRTAMSKRMNMNISILYYYRSVDAYLKEVIDKDRQQRLRSQFQTREEELENLVLKAIEQLHQDGQSVTLRAIAGIVHVDRKSLMRYPRVKAILDPIANKVHRKRDE